MSLFDLFSRKVTLKDSGLLTGFVDNHSHLLPGVDDGIKKMENTLSLLSTMEQYGVSECWFTPHIMEDIPNTTAELKQRFDEVKSLYKGSMTLNLAAEYMLDNLFEERLEAKDLLPHKDKSILVESSCLVAPYGFESKLAEIKHFGYFPILAHPERYIFMQSRDYEKLQKMDVRFQLNITSLLGFYGPEVKSKAELLLEKGMYNYVGTDTHRVDRWNLMLEQKIKQKYVDLLNCIIKN